MNLNKLKKTLKRKQKQVDKYLARCLPLGKTFPQPIYQAMRYSLLAGGKRFRPVLVLLTGQMLGAKAMELLPVAAALEMIHTYSLIHDDLPVMDNDDLRRGKPTNHKVFGEAMAVLAGDALLTMSFKLIADKVKNKKLAARLVSEISGAAGAAGMVGGQVLDMFAESRKKGAREKLGRLSRAKYLKTTHQLKTAAMITASVRSGALVAGARPGQLRKLTVYGRSLGLAFQIMDDLLDLKGSKRQLGKTPRKDARAGKLTYPSLWGTEQSFRQVQQLVKTAKRSLISFGPRAGSLRDLADYGLQRGN